MTGRSSTSCSHCSYTNNPRQMRCSGSALQRRPQRHCAALSYHGYRDRMTEEISRMRFGDGPVPRSNPRAGAAGGSRLVTLGISVAATIAGWLRRTCRSIMRRGRAVRRRAVLQRSVARRSRRRPRAAARSVHLVGSDARSGAAPLHAYPRFAAHVARCAAIR